MSNTTTPPAHQPLTLEIVGKLAGITNRLKQIAQQKVKTAALEEEAQVLLTTLSEAMLRHSAEFISAWFTVAEEYMPLVNSFASLQQRAANFSARRAQALAAAQAAQANPPSNIITPPDFKREESSAPAKE